MENKKNHRIQCAVALLAVGLLSVSAVSLLGIWKNRSFYFDDYIYGGNLSIELSAYYDDLNVYLTGQMLEDEQTRFAERAYGMYYYVVDQDTSEVYTNIPDSMNYTEFSQRPGIKTLRFEHNTYPAYTMHSGSMVVARVLEQPTGRIFAGHVFVDLNAGPLLYSAAQYSITTGLGQQRILYIETAVFVSSFLLGLMLLAVSFRKIKIVPSLSVRMPMDVSMTMLTGAGLALLFLARYYMSTLRSFSLLGRRAILYAVLVALTLFFVLFVIDFLSAMRLYMTDRTKLRQVWDNRLTKNVPPWATGLTAMIIWYFVVLAAFAPGLSVWDYGYMIRIHSLRIAIHIAILTMFFLFIRKLWKTKMQYAQEVLYAAQEIAKGHFGRTIPVVGSDAYAQIASATNDITEGYMRALNEQKKSERLKYELVTNISHDLRTPLTSILNYIGLVKRGELPAEMKRYVGLVDINARKLNLLIEDLFELSSIESGNIELNISQVDIILLLKQIAHEYEEEARHRGLELVSDFSSDKAMIDCDSLKMWRVFDNILNNAMKYSLAGTRIYITAEEEGGRMMISVKNIASYRMNVEPSELFLRFKRGDDARATEGSGLGLAIAKGLVELHKGSIHIEIEGDMFKVIVRL